MLATLVPDKLTPLTAGEVARAFQYAFTRLIGHPPKPRTLAILMAQSALESGRWKSLHCFNLTNIKASTTYEGLYCLYRCNEIINGKVEWFDPPHPQCRFRAFESLEDASLDYLTFLQRPRYKPAWEQALAGDPVAFVAALKRGGFFTANEEPYRKAVVSLMNEYVQKLDAWLADGPDPEPGIVNIDHDHDLRAGAQAAAREITAEDRALAHAAFVDASRDMMERDGDSEPPPGVA
jgi:hypothetical protein